MFPMSRERCGFDGGEFCFGAYQQDLHFVYQFTLS